MKEEIIRNLNDPRQLERLYRSDKLLFKRTFLALYPELKDNPIADFWKERLQYETVVTRRSRGTDWLFVLIAAMLAGILAKLPSLLGIKEEFFYPRNIGFIVFPFLAAWFAWKNQLPVGKILIGAVVVLASAVFINLLPANLQSDTLDLSCMHLLIVLWFVTGYFFVGGWKNEEIKRLGFLQYNGDLLVMSALILIAGGILSGITMGLFSLIGLNIEVFYMQNIVVFGLPAVPILATLLIRTNPQLVGRVSPVIAKIFSPLVLVMLMVYIVAMFYSGKNPYNNREFLIIFNVVLLGVMALIFFSLSGSTSNKPGRTETIILLLLSLVTIVVNSIALSAILFRISEWGFTPNRTAVLGSNLLILVHLLLVTVRLFKTILQKGDVDSVGNIIVRYLPAYLFWAAVVTFLFPFLFGFK